MRGAVIKILCLFQSNRLKIKEDTVTENRRYLFNLVMQVIYSDNFLGSLEHHKLRYCETQVSFLLFLLKFNFSKCHLYFNF